MASPSRGVCLGYRSTAIPGRSLRVNRLSAIPTSGVLHAAQSHPPHWTHTLFGRSLDTHVAKEPLQANILNQQPLPGSSGLELQSN